MKEVVKSKRHVIKPFAWNKVIEESNEYFAGFEKLIFLAQKI